MDYGYQQLLTKLEIKEQSMVATKKIIDAENRKKFLMEEIDSTEKEKREKEKQRKELGGWDDPQILNELNQSIMELISKGIQLKKEFNELGSPIDESELMRLERVYQHAEKEHAKLNDEIAKHTVQIQKRFNELCDRYNALKERSVYDETPEFLLKAAFELASLANEFRDLSEYDVAVAMAEKCDALANECSEKS